MTKDLHGLVRNLEIVYGRDPSEANAKALDEARALLERHKERLRVLARSTQRRYRARRRDTSADDERTALRGRLDGAGNLVHSRIQGLDDEH